MLGLFAVSFSYAFCFNTINNIVIPKEVERLTTYRQSMWVGLVMAVGAVSQLATPIVGAWSDRAGNRTSFLIYGTFTTIVGIVIFIVVHSINDLFLLFLAHVVTTVGLSVQYSMVTALLNDFISEEQTGKGSGAMAILAIFGSGAGYLIFAFNLPLNYSFMAYILSSATCLGICMLFVPAPIPLVEIAELGTSTPTKRGRVKAPIGCLDRVMSPLSIPSPVKYPDFFFACAGRALFNCGLAGQVYLVYYLRDVFAATNPVQITSVIAVMALVGGVVGALPAGILSDRVGKKPVIYGSVVVCIVSLAFFMVVQEVHLIHFVGFIYGVGNIAYLSVDYALGVQALPKRRGVPVDAAKDLGVFAMSATVGQLFGQVVYGAVLDQYGTMTATGTLYSFMGFMTIYTMCGACFAFSGFLTSLIRSVR
jgi:MFS family permease